MKINPKAATSVLEIGSAGAVVAGASIWSLAAGLIVAGGFGLLFAKDAKVSGPAPPKE